jgi:uncharacterized protein (TIGR03437 family)
MLDWFESAGRMWRSEARRRAARISLLCLMAATVHAGPDFAAVLGGSGQDFATSVASDGQGNVYVAGLTYSPDFRVTPGAFQTIFGGTCDAFVAKIGPDGKVIWSTYIGGILDDWATGVAVDGAGNVLVAGYSRSGNFPLVNALKTTLNGTNADDYDAFVAKLDPNGAKLAYSTFLGGRLDDGAAGLAADTAGNAYVAVTVQSAAGYPGTQNAPDQFGIVVSKLNPQGALIYSSYHQYGSAGAIAVDPAGSAYVAGTSYSYNPKTATQTFGTAGNAQAMVFKLSPDGSKKIFETTLGGSVRADATAIAVDTAGQVTVAGGTTSVDFPLARPLQSSPGARPLWKSIDAGTSWTPSDDLPFALPQAMAVNPSNPKTAYIATGDLGVFKSADLGATWTRANAGIASTNVPILVADPAHAGTLYAVSVASTSSSAVYKTVDDANSWTLIDSPAGQLTDFAVDAQNPNILWEIGNTLRKSTDAGATWNAVAFPGTVQTMVLDPRVSGNLVAISNLVFCGSFCTGNQNPQLFLSSDGGAHWTPKPWPGNGRLVVDASTNPSTFYVGLNEKSVDGGVTWSPITPPPGAFSGSSTPVVDPAGTLYVAVSGTGNFVSHDHAQTWTPIGSFIPPWNSGSGPSITRMVPAGSTGTLYAETNQVASSGFVAKLSADGSSIVYSTYLRGHASMESYLLFAAEPNAVAAQSWISGVALDAAGNATVAGGTRAVDFPASAPAQPASAGLADAFVTTISADGSSIRNSTYFGGSQDDSALATGLDSQGNMILVGQTWSGDFPVLGGIQPPHGYGEAFVAKLAQPGAPVISSVLNGASFQPGIEAGSWVTIEGTSLANTFPGRTWRSDEIIGGKLPTSLDGVSVTIDGKPAFVYYISRSQINVEAPSDSVTGKVDVVVNNNGKSSVPAAAQLQDFAPAFFMYPSAGYAVASRLPDYAPIADPSVIPGTVAAKPGDLVVLWGTGFGATNPSVPAGSPVNGAPVVLTAPTVMVGGTAAQVIGTVQTPGSVGLYQVTIQMPGNVPTGAVNVQASVGGQQTQPALLFVSKP